MEITFSKLLRSERNTSYEIFKTYMMPVVAGSFGWDEAFQKHGFENHLHSEWFSWVLINNNKVGMICSRLKESSIHVHLLVIFREAQRKGIARSVTGKLKSEATAQKLDLTLSCFKNNEPALNLYRQLGFVVKSEDEYFYDFISKREHT